MKRVLVTGGAGFIGSHLVSMLLAAGCVVMSFDALLPQVHPKSPNWPDYQPDQENLVKWTGDVRDIPFALEPAIREFKPDTIIHLAAMVGVGQSNYKVGNYVSANVTGTAALLGYVADHNSRIDAATEDLKAILSVMEDPDFNASPDNLQKVGDDAKKLKAILDANTRIEQVFVAGSMSSYGEGWADSNGPLPTPEVATLTPASVYAWSKAQQEELALLLASLRPDVLAVKIGRFFNAYGPNQALTNPYTGVAAIFSARLMAGLPPILYGDGSQSRDFIHVSDIATGIITILEKGLPSEVYNIGTGVAANILSLANLLAERIPDAEGCRILPNVTGFERVGDIQHCYADNQKLRQLGWEPKITLDVGIADLVEWVRSQPVEEREEVLNRAHFELSRLGLLKIPLAEDPPHTDEDFVEVVSDQDGSGMNVTILDPSELEGKTVTITEIGGDNGQS